MKSSYFCSSVRSKGNIYLALNIANAKMTPNLNSNEVLPGAKSIALINVFPLYTGTTSYVLEYSRALKELGFKVRLYQLIYRGEENRYPSADQYIVGSNLPIKSLRLPFDLLFTLPSKIEKIGEDIIILTDQSLLKLKVKYPNSITIVTDLRDLSPYSKNPLRKIFFMYLLRYLKEGDKVIAISDFTAKQIKKITGISKHIEVVPLCSPYSIKQNVVNERIDRRIHERKEFNALYIAADRPYKNLNLFIELAKMMESEEGIKFKFTLVSKLKKRTWLKIKKISPHNLQVKREIDDLYRIYFNTDILLFPSLTEGFGLPTVEAMSFGIPIIYSSLPPMTDIVDNGGIAVDPKRPVQWVEQMMKMKDSSMYRRMAYAAYNQSKFYSFEKFKERLYNVLSSFCGSGDSGDKP